MGTSKLLVDVTTDSNELSFNDFKWKLFTKWEGRNVLFDRSWEKFVTEANLHEGDVCVIQKTGHDKKFKVAVFEANYTDNINTAGIDFIRVFVDMKNCLHPTKHVKEN